jgi:hypothetical protein
VKNRLLLLVLAVVLAGVVGWILGRGGDGAPLPGLTVDVEVVDPLGVPVPKAQAQPRYRPGWRPVDAAGRVRLEGVVLRADDTPSPDAIAAALDVRSPAHAARRPPQVEQGADGSWRARYVLDAFGTIRLRILDTTLEDVKAWIVPDPTRGGIESTSGVAVARPGQPAAWRVFGGVEAVEVRIEGAMGVAARSVLLDAPSAGFVREFGLEAEPSRPIRGHVAPAGGSPDGEDVALPSLRGRMDVTELTDDGREVAHPPVWVRDDGSFEVTYAGEGRYVLTPVLYYASVAPQRVRGGDLVSFAEVRARPWLVLPPGDLTDASLPTPRMRLRRVTEDGEEPVRSWSLFSADEGWMLSVPGPGRYRVVATRMGTAEAVPAAGAAEVEVTGPGPHPVALELEGQLCGDVRVRVETATDEGGADVDLEADGDRHATVLFAFGREALIPKVREGPFTVRVVFSDRTLAVVFLADELQAGTYRGVVAQGVVGGDVVLEGRGAGVVDDTRSRRFAWQGGDSPYRGAAGDVVLVREAGTTRWRSTHRLAPGRYRGTLAPLPFTDAQRQPVGPPPEREGRDVELVVTAGETTVVDLEVP